MNNFYEMLEEYEKELQNNVLNKDNFLSKFDPIITDNYIFNDNLYAYCYDIELTHKVYPELSIFVYKNEETDEIDVYVPNNHGCFKTEDEAIDFINKEIRNYHNSRID